ncbi:hypothetical protein NBRC116188_20300 [Oceaniserpentilla sp. 4NH20-0058]|uniref:redoxin family protein n=1 Tax=Oceaniserpentilla sp. 4NH20-0058 TaxID=3127660 RepID=UPI00310B6707
MKSLFIMLGTAALTFVLLKPSIQSANAEINPFPLPEFTQTEQNQWLKSKPLNVEELKGKVLLVDIWTFACWNCYRSFPWLNQLEASLHNQDFQVIGIHTPEFDYEKKRSAVLAKMSEFELDHPVMMDNDFKYWKRLNNQYWPTYYLVDKKGMVRYRFIGETHANTNKAAQISSAIAILLKE